MSSERQAAVIGWGLCLVGFPSAKAWAAGERTEGNKPAGTLIERRSRRRCSDDFASRGVHGSKPGRGVLANASLHHNGHHQHASYHQTDSQ